MRVLIGWPSAQPIVDYIRKHVKYALNHPAEVDLAKVVEETKGRMTASMVKYPELQEHFAPVLEKLSGE